MPLRSDSLERLTMRFKWLVGLLLVGMLTLVGCGDARETESAVSDCWTEDQRAPGGQAPADKQWTTAPAMTVDPAKSYRATIQTSKGSFEVELLPKEAPLAVNNFVCLARAGYFDDTVFHRVVPGFVIQGGDPTASGRGNPGYRFPDEPITRDYATGTLAMANSGPDTNGSQFFVVLEGGASQLQKLYTIFGQVTEGMEVVEAIGQTNPSTEPVTLESVTIAEE